MGLNKPGSREHGAEKLGEHGTAYRNDFNVLELPPHPLQSHLYVNLVHCAKKGDEA